MIYNPTLRAKLETLAAAAGIPAAELEAVLRDLPKGISDAERGPILARMLLRRGIAKRMTTRDNAPAYLRAVAAGRVTATEGR